MSRFAFRQAEWAAVSESAVRAGSPGACPGAGRRGARRGLGKVKQGLQLPSLLNVAYHMAWIWTLMKGSDPDGE